MLPTNKRPVKDPEDDPTGGFVLSQRKRQNAETAISPLALPGGAMAQQDPDAIRRRYQAALESLVGKVRQDTTIIAALLAGSLSYDQVWERSDIDLWLVTKDERRPVREYCLLEDNINVHCVVFARSRFKQWVESALQSSFIHSALSKSTLLFATDPSVGEYLEQAKRVGDHDRQIQLMRLAAGLLPTLYKAQKWLVVKNDPTYSALWVMYLLGDLASIEVVLHGEITTREVINQAMAHNPAFFGEVYTGLLHGPKDAKSVGRVLDLIDGYLSERIPLLFQPILDYLHESGGVRTTTELNAHFYKRAHIEARGLESAFEWLADKGVIQKLPTPVRLTEKSRVQADEAAYYYDKEEGV
jgi:uncharacterized protein